MVPLRSLAWLLLPVVALGGAAAVVQQRRVTQHWEIAAQKIESQSRLVSSRRIVRDALWGETEEGSAFADYRVAMETADHLWGRATGGFLGPAGATLADLDLQNAEVRDALLMDPLAHSVLESLRRGAHRSDATLEFDWSGSPEVPLASPSAPARVRLVAHAAAYDALANDEPIEAARWVLDVLQFGADLSAGPTYLIEMVGVGLLASDAGLTTDATDGSWGKLGPHGRRYLVRGLRRLETRLLETRPFPEGEFVYVGRSLQEAYDVGDPRSSVQIGGSLTTLLERGQIAGFLVTTARWTETYGDAVAEGWVEALRAAEMIEAEALQFDHEPLVTSGSHPRATLQSRVYYTARVQALRLGLEALDGHVETRPLDPLGDPLNVEVQEGVARVRSTSESYPRFELVTSTCPLR
ncbi:MAG: hypothetical protein AAGA20_20960 [Planctomycetota bacterium]